MVVDRMSKSVVLYYWTISDDSEPSPGFVRLRSGGSVVLARRTSLCVLAYGDSQHTGDRSADIALPAVMDG
jgi:hypothetical protein